MAAGESDFDFAIAEVGLEFRGHVVAHVRAAGEGGEGREDEEAVAVQEGPVAAFDLGGVAEFHDGMEVADDGQRAGFGARGELVAVDGADAICAPFGLVVLAAVVVAGDADDLGLYVQRCGDELGFFGAGVGGVDNVTDEDEGLGIEIATEGVELFLRTGVGEGPEFAAAALGPGETEMQIGDESRSLLREPEGSAGMEFNHSTLRRCWRRTRRRLFLDPGRGGLRD